MKFGTLFTLMAAVVLGVVSSARASYLFDLTYDDGVNQANGQVTADFVYAGVYHAVSGVLNVTGGLLSPGSYQLAAASGGAFAIDNLLFNSADPYLDVNGLLFKSATTEINLWGNGPGNYSFYGWTATGGYSPQFTGDANTSLTMVPEPTTWLAGALMLLPFGMGAVRGMRRNRVA